MENKTYKTRVEVSLILEIDVEACHEDNAGAIAEELADGLVAETVSAAEYGTDGVYVAAWGVSCTDVEEVSYE